MHVPAHAFLRRLVLAAAACLGLWLGQPLPAAAQHLADFLDQVTPGALLPGADRFGPPEGSPPIVPAYAGDKLLGWAYLNTDLTTATGYSGWPIQILIGLTTERKIGGARLMEHHEPMLLSGIPPERIDALIRGYVGADVSGVSSVVGRRPLDLISGATVSMMVIGDSILRSAVLLDRRLRPAVAATTPPPPAVEEAAAVEDWAALLADGSVRRLRLTVGQVSDAFAGAGYTAAALAAEREDRAADFIDLYAAPVSLPMIGHSLLGEVAYRRLRAELKPGQAAIALFANGTYAYKGAGAPRIGTFDRFALVQGGQTIRFTDRNQRRLDGAAAAGAPDFAQADLFLLPEGAWFDPAAPWRLQLLAGRGTAFLTFDLAYDPPAGDRALAAPPLWRVLWRADAGKIAVLAVALALLTAIFFCQDWLAHYPVLQDRLRLGFLLFTLVWIGGYAQAQLSVVNVLAFLAALRTDFHWDVFLMAPLIFILWAATATAMLFWNRGAFCGWLCPFGAAQELLSRGARALGIRQIAIPFGMHQRLSAIKYVIFLGLFAISLDAFATAERFAEVEPFKTVFALRFARDWPFVLYAVAALAPSLVIERFFCRYLCPLGAALAIPARLRLFDWLRRYRDCGSPCQRCAHECPVQAIHPEGHINPSECIQCLHCQVLYHHAQRCPVITKRRHRREKLAATRGE